MIIWIILVIAFVAGVTWRVVRAQRQSRRWALSFVPASLSVLLVFLS